MAHFQYDMPPKMTHTCSTRIQKDAAAECTSSAANAPSEVLHPVSLAPLAPAARVRTAAASGVLLSVLHNAMSTFSAANGFGNKTCWDTGKDVVLSVAFKSASTKQAWVEFGLKLADVRSELSRSTVEQSKLLGQVRSVCKIFCNMNDMPDFNEKVTLEPVFGRETITVLVGLRCSPCLPVELKQDMYYSQLRI